MPPLQQVLAAAKYKRSSIVTVDPYAPSVTGINMDDFKTLFTCEYQTMIDIATKIKVLEDGLILSLLHSNPYLNEYMMFNETSSRIFLVVGILQKYINPCTTKILVTGKTALQLTAVLNSERIKLLNTSLNTRQVDAFTAPGVELLRPCTDFDMYLVTDVHITPSLKQTFFSTILLFFIKSGIIHNIESSDVLREKYDKFLGSPNTFLTVLSRGSPNTISLKKGLGLGQILDILDVKFQTNTEIKSIFPNLNPSYCRVSLPQIDVLPDSILLMLPDLLSLFNECIQITIKELNKLLTNKCIPDDEFYFFVITTLLKFFSRAVQFSYMQADEHKSTRSIILEAVAHNNPIDDTNTNRMINDDLLPIFLLDNYRLNPCGFNEFAAYKATNRIDWKNRSEMPLHENILSILKKKYRFVPPPPSLMGGKKNKLKTKRKTRKAMKTMKTRKAMKTMKTRKAMKTRKTKNNNTKKKLQKNRCNPGTNHCIPSYKLTKKF